MASSAKHLFLDSTIFDLQANGGISRYWYEFVSNLARRHEEWNLTLFADPHTVNKFGRKLIESTQDKPNVRLYGYKPKQQGRFFGPWLSNDYTSSLWHSSYYRVPAGISMPEICTVQDCICERYSGGVFPWLQRQKKRRAILRARQIICPSEATKRDLLEFYPRISESICNVVRHGLSHVFLSIADAVADAPHRSPYILFVGSRAQYKNFRLTVLSVEAVPGLALYIAGGKDLSQGESALLNEHLPTRYRVFDAPTDEALCDLYRGAAALAYLSTYEGFGFPPLEAMACGCPVIAMESTSIPEVVGDAGMLLSTDDPNVVAEALRAIQTPERRRACVDKGRRRAKEFNWDRTVDDTVAVYERAMV